MVKRDVKNRLHVRVMSASLSCQQKSRKSAGVLLSVKKEIGIWEVVRAVNSP